MAPALLELLQSHGRLPPSEPVAEYSCPQHDVRTLKATMGLACRLRGGGLHGAVVALAG